MPDPVFQTRGEEYQFVICYGVNKDIPGLKLNFCFIIHHFYV